MKLCRSKHFTSHLVAFARFRSYRYIGGVYGVWGWLDRRQKVGL